MAERAGSVWEYPLADDMELVIYPLLFDEHHRLTYGKQRNDFWIVAFDYGSKEEAIANAIKWTNFEEPPPGPWLKQIGEMEHTTRGRT